MGRLCSLPFALLVLLVAMHPAAAQAPSGEETRRAHAMLAQIRDDLKKYYYDSTFGGTDINRRVREADAAIDQAATLNEQLAAIAQFVLDFHDSHTFFLPPDRAAEVDYGWAWTSVGANCFVDTVVKGSDDRRDRPQPPIQPSRQLRLQRLEPPTRHAHPVAAP